MEIIKRNMQGNVKNSPCERNHIEIDEVEHFSVHSTETNKDNVQILLKSLRPQCKKIALLKVLRPTKTMYKIVLFTALKPKKTM